MQNKHSSVKRGRQRSWILSAQLGLTGMLLAGLMGGCTREPVSRGTRAALGTPTPSDGGGMRYHALVIGISDYDRQHGNGWEPLHTARHDAEAVAMALRDRYGFEVTSLLDQDATRAAVLSALDKLSSLTPQDAAIVYYAGHGYYDDGMDEGYWIPADARSQDGERLPKEDWIWNSMITKIVGASQARHILVVADSCYGGSMFRGPPAKPTAKDLTWYQRAIAKPSRYLITSGDIEPVLDSGGRHSIFAQELLNYLNYSDARIFAASDLAFSLREKVSALTGQMVRMGPLAVASHAGGEFIFIPCGANLPATQTAAVSDSTLLRRDAAAKASATAPSLPAERQMAGDAVTLNNLGATNSAQTLLAALAQAGSDDRLIRSMTAYLDGAQQQRDREELGKLMDRIGKNAAAQPDSGGHDGTAYPRILACLGPVSADGGTDSQSAALLLRIALRSELEQSGLVQVVEREALQEVLQELNLGVSNLGDPRAQLAIGKVLPASTLLLGDLMSGQGARQLYLRLVDTETTRIIASYSSTLEPGQDMFAACADLAKKIARKTAEWRPLTAQAELTSDGLVNAQVGSFQGVKPNDRFQVLDRLPTAAGQAGAPADHILSEAVILSVDDSASRMKTGTPIDPAQFKGTLWVREILP